MFSQLIVEDLFLKLELTVESKSRKLIFEGFDLCRLMVIIWYRGDRFFLLDYTKMMIMIMIKKPWCVLMLRVSFKMFLNSLWGYLTRHVKEEWGKRAIGRLRETEKEWGPGSTDNILSAHNSSLGRNARHLRSGKWKSKAQSVRTLNSLSSSLPLAHLKLSKQCLCIQLPTDSDSHEKLQLPFASFFSFTEAWPLRDKSVLFSSFSICFFYFISSWQKCVKLC